MLFKRRLAERYIAAAILPYLALSSALLTAALLAQQTTRFAEIIGTARTPLGLTIEVLISLLPNILVFTIPTATLVGTVIGFSRLSGDSELVAMRAAGISTFRVIAPPVLLGLLLSIISFQVSFNVAPEAARHLRRIAAEAALYKLESPVEPRTFYTDMPGKIVFVREGEQDSGQWGRVFIHWQDQGGEVRLVTARSGRIDSSGEQTELVLSDAEVITLPALEQGTQFDGRQITSERSSMLRMKDERLDSGRKALLKRLNEHELVPEEMGWRELSENMRATDDPQKRQDIFVAFQRRAALCVAPLFFSLFGGAVGLRARRGGKGVGMLLSIVTLIIYYLLSVGGGHLGRAAVIPPVIGVWLANGLIAVFGILLLLGGESFTFITRKKSPDSGALKREGETAEGRSRLNWGLMDRHVLRSLGWGFAGSFVVLVSVFLIFTLFDLLRFLATQGANAGIVARYLLYMLPFATVAMAPMSLLVATLVTYALMTRRSEAVAWWASGRSVYRLIVPGLLFASAVCVGVWLVQEEVLPQANRVQNSLRAQIRSGGRAQINTPVGRQWLATSDLLRLYSYDYDPSTETLLAPLVFEFGEGGVHLRQIVVGARGQWAEESGVEVLRIDATSIIKKAGGGVEAGGAGRVDILEPRQAFKPALNNPAESDFKQLSDDLKRLRRRGDPSVPLIAVARERKLSDPVSPLILSLIGMPLAFAFGRRNAISALSVAVVIGVAFWASTSGFYYLGARGFLPAVAAAWTPPAIFAAIGIYLLTRART